MKMIVLSYMDLGLTISVIGYVIVLIALSFLVGIYIAIPHIIKTINKAERKRQEKKDCGGKECPDITGDEMAAISSAIYLFFSNTHDEESNTITIKRVTKAYTPWSSKIYSMNKYSK